MILKRQLASDKNSKWKFAAFGQFSEQIRDKILHDLF